MPVMPGFSFDDPTWATHPPEMRGSPERSTMSSFMPLERVFSRTGICWAQETAVIPIARITPASPLLHRSDPDFNVIAITVPKEAAPAPRGNGRDVGGDGERRGDSQKTPIAA